MPIVTKTEVKQVTEEVGMICDCCGTHFDEDGMQFHDFRIDYTFGYASVADMINVKAVICDNCLLGIVLASVPGATFSSEGSEVDKNWLASRLKAEQAHRG